MAMSKVSKKMCLFGINVASVGKRKGTIATVTRVLVRMW